MTRLRHISGALVLAILSSGCSAMFKPIEPEPRPTPIDAFDRAERERLDAQRTYPDCRERTTDDKDYPRRCSGQQRPQ